MSRREPEDDQLTRELAQHEAPERLHWFDVDRRGFLRLLGGGLLVCLYAPIARSQESGRSGQGRREMPRELGAWLHIGKDGRITVFTGKVEVGQNIRTSLAQQVAEELRVSVDSIEMVMADTDRTPWDAGTFGSRTTRTMAPHLRAVAATARETLAGLASERWNVERASLALEEGKIVHSLTRRTLTYEELTRGENLVKVVATESPVTPPAQWKVAGKALPKVDGRDFVTGKHRYTSDLARPGMMHGKVLRPPTFKATLASLDATKAERIPGVRVVRDGDFAGVIAPDLWTAQQGLEALEAKWKESATQPSNRDIFEYLKQNAQTGDAGDRRVSGLVEQALAAAEVKLSQRYTVEYIAHAPLEPRAAVAEWDGEKLIVWTGTQRPFGVREELAEVFRIPVERVRTALEPDGGATARRPVAQGPQGGGNDRLVDHGVGVDEDQKIASRDPRAGVASCSDLAMSDVNHPRVVFLGDGGRSVGRGVVGDDHLVPLTRGPRGGVKGPERRRKQPLFVVGRHDKRDQGDLRPRAFNRRRGAG